MKTTLKMPDGAKRALKRSEKIDTDYFNSNPLSRAYTRAYIPGEMWPEYPPEGSMIRVMLFDTNKRARAIIPPEGSDWQPKYKPGFHHLYVED